MTDNIPIGILSVMDSEELSKAQRTRRFIIERSAPLFNKKGYSGTSLSDLTAATGLTKGSIYGNFKDKDDVALSAFRHNVNFIIQAIGQRMEAARSCFDKLMVYPDFYRKISRHIISYGGCPIINTLVESDDTHDGLRSQAIAVLVLWKKTIVTLFNNGKKNGEFGDDIDADAFADLVISLVEGAVAMTKATGSESFIINAMDHLETVIVSLRRDASPVP